MMSAGFGVRRGEQKKWHGWVMKGKAKGLGIFN
jgi:hypothetical protein